MMRTRCLSLLALPLLGCGAETSSAGADGPVHPGVDAVFADLDRDDAPGAAVGVLLDGAHLVAQELQAFGGVEEL
ncbi:MAG: hypothetical protein ACPHO4_08645, partial [Longimicrobiales bacterium]